jgi:hypothetical protein
MILRTQPVRLAPYTAASCLMQLLPLPNCQRTNSAAMKLRTSFLPTAWLLALRRATKMKSLHLASGADQIPEVSSRLRSLRLLDALPSKKDSAESAGNQEIFLADPSHQEGSHILFPLSRRRPKSCQDLRRILFPSRKRQQRSSQGRR